MSSTTAATVRLSDERAQEVLRAAEHAWHERDPEALIAALHPDVRIRFNNLPEVRGIDAARAWIQRRFDTQLGYRLAKTLRGVDGTMIVSSWTGRWRDAPTGEVRLCRGIELLTLDGDLIRDWDGVMHVWNEES